MEPVATDGLKPENAAGYACRGSVYLQVRRYEEAVADMTAFVERVPEPQAIQWQIRATAYLNLRRWPEAEKDLDAALASEHSAGGTGGIGDLDDYSACGIRRPEDIRDLFVNNFYFGCEADDPTNAYAFNRKANPYRAQLKVLFGSDIGHFDVPDMKEVVPEAYELVEDELITADDFRDFMFTNPVKFWGEANPRFFDSTRVAKEASAVLAEPKAAPREAWR